MILGYMAETIYEILNIKCAILAFAYILSNPYTGTIAMYPWKDVTFAITVLWIMCVVVRIIFKKYNSDKLKIQIILLGILMANATVFRHNAILFTGTLLIALLFVLERKQVLNLVIICATMLILIKGPAYFILDVVPAEKRTQEVVGLPLTILANVTKETPELLNNETAKFMYSIADQADWEGKYVCGDFNSIKWSGIDLSIVNQTNIGKILKMTLNSIVESPQASLEAVISLTNIVYGIEGEIKGDTVPAITPNEIGICYSGNVNIANFLQSYRTFYNNSIFKYLRYVGVSIVLMLWVILGKMNLKCKNDWKKIGLCIPIFIYNFGTMLMLSGQDLRFFYVSFLVCPMVFLIILKEEET